MASQVTTDGHVIAPLNITKPAPIISLRGFHWDTVDEKIHGQPQSEQSQPDKIQDEQQAFRVADAAPRFQVKDGVKSAAPLPLPKMPLSGAAMPLQLPGQLGVVPGLPPPSPPKFPLEQFQGAYAGNGFNLIWRPRMGPDIPPLPMTPPGDHAKENMLQLNLTTEQLTFGPTIGNIPNRGSGANGQNDIILGGFPYLQTVQDVTNKMSGKADNPAATGIHFEPGMWLNVPRSDFHPAKGDSVVRMASIPHGTTINAQGFVPAGTQSDKSIGGTPDKPDFGKFQADATPFLLGKPSSKIPFPAMDAGNNNTFRIPQDLKSFVDKGTITTEIIKNPNKVLENAIAGQTITETITFEVSTGAPTAKLNAGGTANISFLAGKQEPVNDLQINTAPGEKDFPNAHAASMTARYWIESVVYDVKVPELPPDSPPVLLRPEMANTLAPTPIFAITPPKKGVPPSKDGIKIKVPGIQIQSSQTVDMNFRDKDKPMLTWPHISVATLVPVDPQPFTMT